LKALVEIDELPSELARKRARHARLSAAHHPDQHDRAPNGRCVETMSKKHSQVLTDMRALRKRPEPDFPCVEGLVDEHVESAERPQPTLLSRGQKRRPLRPVNQIE